MVAFGAYPRWAGVVKNLHTLFTFPSPRRSFSTDGFLTAFAKATASQSSIVSVALSRPNTSRFGGWMLSITFDSSSVKNNEGVRTFLPNPDKSGRGDHPRGSRENNNLILNKSQSD